MLHIIVDKREINYSYIIKSQNIIAVELSHNKKNNKLIVDITIKDKDNNRIYINSENYKEEEIKDLMYFFNGLNLDEDKFKNNLLTHTVIFEDEDISFSSNIIEEGEEEE